MRKRGEDGRARVQAENPRVWWLVTLEASRRAAGVGRVLVDLCGGGLDRQADGSWWPGVGLIAAAGHFSPSTAKRGLRDLRGDGSISYGVKRWHDPVKGWQSRIVDLRFWAPVVSVRARNAARNPIGVKLTPATSPSALRSSSADGSWGPDSEMTAAASRGDPPGDPFDSDSIPARFQSVRSPAEARAALGLRKG